jgi:hypothetical protein
MFLTNQSTEDLIFIKKWKNLMELLSNVPIL